MTLSNFTYDPALVAELAASFGLRKANIRALDALTKRLEHQDTGDEPVVMDMATGAGKTYVMAAFIEYLRRQGHRNVMIVTPVALWCRRRPWRTSPLARASTLRAHLWKPT